MHTIQQPHHQSVADFLDILLASPCVADLGLGAASVLAHFSVEGRLQFLWLRARTQAALFRIQGCIERYVKAIAPLKQELINIRFHVVKKDICIF